jgi:hypothetical protein
MQREIVQRDVVRARRRLIHPGRQDATAQLAVAQVNAARKLSRTGGDKRGVPIDMGLLGDRAAVVMEIHLLRKSVAQAHCCLLWGVTLLEKKSDNRKPDPQ